MTITQNVNDILRTLPPGVTLEAAAKTRGIAEVREAIDAGVTVIGENYLQESLPVIGALRPLARWHFIGTVQSNKVRDIVQNFDLVETVSSIKIASKIDTYAEERGTPFDVLIEVNSACEEQKSGVCPDDVEVFSEELAAMPTIRLRGLMTMGPWTSDPEDTRGAFAATRRLFERINERRARSDKMDMLSMGMSASYRVAIEEGATIVRLGEALFGPRR